MRMPTLSKPVLFAAAMAAGTAPLGAQQPPATLEELLESVSAGARASRAAGAFVVELSDGTTADLSTPGCGPPEVRDGVVKIDCSAFDGPVYYFDESTREILAVCSIWFLGACPPRRWPVEPSGCAARVGEGITGTWRLDSWPTAQGYRPIGDGWAITLAANSILFELSDGVSIERNYAATALDDVHYSLRLTDADGAAANIGIELLQCGLVVETDDACDAFCETFNAERLNAYGGGDVFLSVMTDILGDRVAEEFLEQSRRQPVFTNRSYFRPVVTDRGR